MPMIELRGVSLSYPQKTCFSDFDTAIEWGQRIAIVGDNGSGKSSLLRMLQGSLAPSEGNIEFSTDVTIGYVEQLIDGTDSLSGGQRVNQALSQALGQMPDLLLLDEPTNHLDVDNRRSLSRMLQNFYGTIVMVTHDHALMDQTCDTIWHIGHGHVSVFSGCYADYLAEQELQRNALQKQLSAVKRAKVEAHEALMQEQERAANARQRGIKSIQDRKWATVKSPTKLGRGNTTAGRKQSEIREEQRALTDQLAELQPAEIIVPRFHLPAGGRTRQAVLQIAEGSVGYDHPLLRDIHLSLAYGDRLALSGANGSGKSTLARAIMGDPAVVRTGEWLVPPPHEVGYVDQHYRNLDRSHTVLQALAHVVPDWPMPELRMHLSDFLFRHNETVQTSVAALSGGEKARLSLACIAAKPPQLLILDELTNNLDMRMRSHMVDILKDYPGAMLLITHDEAFLQEIGVTEHYHCKAPRAG